MCCEFGKKLDGNKCIALTDNTCLTVNANGDCTLRSSNTVANCKISFNN